MTDLIERIDKTLENGYSSLGNYSALSIWELLSECRSEIQLLSQVNESLRSQNESLDAECARLEALREYVPISEDEFSQLADIWLCIDITERQDWCKYIEAEVIKRAGLRVKDKP